MTKLKKVDEIFGVTIYFNPVQEVFSATLKGQEYKATRLSDLKRDMSVDKAIDISEPVIYASGDSEIILTTIVEISPHGFLKAKERAGYGVSPNPEPEDVFPRTFENMDIYKTHVSLRNKGWQLIQRANEMRSKLKPFPKDYWKNKAKELTNA